MEQQTYLIRERGRKKAAHIWTGADTACRMWSTGGMSKEKRWILTHDRGEHEVCAMCETNHRKAVAEFASGVGHA